jgi:hypothetical protein
MFAFGISPRPKGTNRDKKKLNLELAGTLCFEIPGHKMCFSRRSSIRILAFGNTCLPSASLPAPTVQNAARRNVGVQLIVQLRYFYFDF